LECCNHPVFSGIKWELCDRGEKSQDQCFFSTWFEIAFRLGNINIK